MDQTPATPAFARNLTITPRQRTWTGTLFSLRSNFFGRSMALGDQKALIDLGDGTVTDAKVEYNRKTGKWDVVGSHPYTKAGKYTIRGQIMAVGDQKK